MFGKTKKGYIDLEEAGVEKREEAKMFVRVAEVHKYEDLKELIKHVYEGNMLLMDISPISADSIEVERIINEMKKVASDINGDIVGIDRNRFIVTPSGVKVDRRKIKTY
ncbi:MAG: cell division protein SepF [Thermoplasmatales archaeon]|nr:cell division protein SepF [Thermoplasmatales archaeon]